MSESFISRPLAAVALGLGMVLSGTGVSAHGLENTSGPTKGVVAPSTKSFWDYVLSAAEAVALFRIDKADGYRYIKSDGLPDHGTGQFPNRGNPHTIGKQDFSFRVPLVPEKAGHLITLGHRPFGVALNGVVFDPLTAEFWNRDRRSGWNIEALSGHQDLGLDDSNAHVQPDGAYHYHGLPWGILERLPFRERPVLLGYAADGHPIYGPYGYTDPNGPQSPVKKLQASFRIKPGTRPSGPGGKYDGTYVQDYEFAAGKGDLDACNGRRGVTPDYPNGTYYYVITHAYPFIPRCFTGIPDRSFERFPSGPPGGGGPGMGGPPQRIGGFDGPPGGPGGPGGRLSAAAKKLGISVDQLRRAIGPPPPDFRGAARKLGISEDKIRRAMGH